MKHSLRGVLIAVAVAGISILGDATVVSQVAADTFGSGANSFEIDFITIGDPRNPPDSTVIPNPAGAVPYHYRIGKYEISEQMIDKANALGGLGTTKDTRGPDMPATSVSWSEAARFVNWLNASSGHSPAYKFDSSGTFQLWLSSDTGYDAENQFRNSHAKYFLASFDEWHKAAYYNRQSKTYFDYPTGSNTSPTAVEGGLSMGTAVFRGFLSPAAPSDITQAGGLSFYGTMAQGGNVAEWNETDNKRSGVEGFRGGSWLHSSSSFRRSTYQHTNNAASDSFIWLGFRVASVVPEPRTGGMVLTALIMLCALKRRDAHVPSVEYAGQLANRLWQGGIPTLLA